MVSFLDKHFEELVAGAGLIVMSTIVFAQVVLRALFQAPMSWSDEIAVYCMVWTVYLSASWAVRERAHIRVLGLVQLAPPALANGLIYLSDLLWFIFSVLLCWQGILLDASLWELTYRSAVLEIDQKWPYMVVAAGFGMMAFRLVQVYYRHFRYGESLTAEAPGPHENSK